MGSTQPSNVDDFDLCVSSLFRRVVHSSEMQAPFTVVGASI